MIWPVKALPNKKNGSPSSIKQLVDLNYNFKCYWLI